MAMRRHARSSIWIAKTSWIQSFQSLFSYRPGLHLIVLMGVVVGFFHGWLKLRYRSSLTTFAFDALMSWAVIACIMTLPRGVPFFPRLPITRAIFAFYVVVAAWAFLPSDLPILVRLASFRGWCFPPLIFGLGFHLTRSVEQVKGFFLVLIVLGVVTGAYGIRQSPEEIQRMMREDEHVALLRAGSGYATASGKGAIRRFSTFVSAGVFGGVMAFVSSIALVLVADSRTKQTQRILLAGALVVMCYAIVLSGSRSPAVNMLLTVGLLSIARRNLLVPILVAAAGYLVLGWAGELTSGAALDRYASLVDKEVVGSRYMIPLIAAYFRLDETLLGTGLGTSSYSVPMFLAGGVPRGSFRGAEGDLNCLAVEMGIVGIFFFARILWEICRSTYFVITDSKDKPHGVIALAAATAVAPTVLNFPVGAPFLGIPTGALTWFFIGCMIKLNELGKTAPATAAAAAIEAPARPAKRFIYWHPNKR